MTTVVSAASTSEATTPTSYISRWIAQSHGAYPKSSNEFYSSSSSSSDFSMPTAMIQTSPTTIPFKPPTTTWQAQARSRLDAVPPAPATSHPSSPHLCNNNELQEKLRRIRTLLDVKKQRWCRHFPLSSPPLAPVENVYFTHDEPSISTFAYHPSSSLPGLIEESPSDSGCSDGTKATNNEDMIDATSRNLAVVDLSKPLRKEEMLAIIQILRELWRKQYGGDIPHVPMKTAAPVSDLSLTRRSSDEEREAGERLSCSLSKQKSQYHSTPTLNKLSAELSDIKDKLKRFSTGRVMNEQRQQVQIPTETKSNELENSPASGENSVFYSFDASLTPQDLERMQAKRDALIRRQIRRREEQLTKRNERLSSAAEQQSEYRLYEEYMSHRRQEDESRRKTILHAHVEQKRLEADPPSNHDYYFAAARNRHRLKRKASMTSFVSFDDDTSFGGSTFDLISSASGRKSVQTPKRATTRFDPLSTSLTAPTAASRSKMNRAASTCNINEHYDSFTSLNSKATMPVSRPTRPAALFGGSLVNMHLMNKNKLQARSGNLIEDAYDLRTESPLSGSLSSLALSLPAGSRQTRNNKHISTKSNKSSILNSLKQVALAGPANEQQRQLASREIESSEARHFVILFRDHRLQFRSVYVYIPDTDIVEKLYGVGPNIITEMMVEKWFKYNSSSKNFTNIPIRHFSIQCDAIIIHNDFWQKKMLLHMNKQH